MDGCARLRRPWWCVDPRIVENQKTENGIGVYFARKVSGYVTAGLLPLGISANQATILWGFCSVANSYVIYRTMVDGGGILSVLLVCGLYFLAEVLDCSDGEIARCRQTSSPVGGKLLDGVCHKATEYSLLVAYVAGASPRVPDAVLLPLGLALLAGEAMYNYCFERRLLVIRLHAKVQSYISPTTSNDVYRSDERWRDFPVRKKINALTGLVQYKSVYFVIALSSISSGALLGGLTLLTIYKHIAWVKLLATTLARPPELARAEPERA